MASSGPAAGWRARPLGADERRERLQERRDLGHGALPRPLPGARREPARARTGTRGTLRVGGRRRLGRLGGLAEDAQGHLRAAGDEVQGGGQLGAARGDQPGERRVVREPLAEAGGQQGGGPLGEAPHRGVVARRAPGRRRPAARAARRPPPRRPRERHPAQRLAGDPPSQDTQDAGRFVGDEGVELAGSPLGAPVQRRRRQHPVGGAEQRREPQVDQVDVGQRRAPRRR